MRFGSALATLSNLMLMIFLLTRWLYLSELLSLQGIGQVPVVAASTLTCGGCKRPNLCHVRMLQHAQHSHGPCMPAAKIMTLSVLHAVAGEQGSWQKSNQLSWIDLTRLFRTRCLLQKFQTKIAGMLSSTPIFEGTLQNVQNSLLKKVRKGLKIQKGLKMANTHFCREHCR